MTYPTKPTNQTQWATDPNADIVEPTQNKKDTGWIREKPSFQTFNWIANNAYKWETYFNNAIDYIKLLIAQEDATTTEPSKLVLRNNDPDYDNLEIDNKYGLVKLKSADLRSTTTNTNFNNIVLDRKFNNFYNYSHKDTDSFSSAITQTNAILAGTLITDTARGSKFEATSYNNIEITNHMPLTKKRTEHAAYVKSTIEPLVTNFSNLIDPSDPLFDNRFLESFKFISGHSAFNFTINPSNVGSNSRAYVTFLGCQTIGEIDNLENDLTKLYGNTPYMPQVPLVIFVKDYLDGIGETLTESWITANPGVLPALDLLKLAIDYVATITTSTTWKDDVYESISCSDIDDFEYSNNGLKVGTLQMSSAMMDLRSEDLNDNVNYDYDYGYLDSLSFLGKHIKMDSIGHLVQDNRLFDKDGTECGQYLENPSGVGSTETYKGGMGFVFGKTVNDVFTTPAIQVITQTQLQEHGTVLDANSSLAFGPYVNHGGTSWTTPSDERIKTITGDIENACENLSKLRTKMAYYNRDEQKKEMPVLMAQDVQKLYPNVVAEFGTDNKLGVDYEKLVPVLIKAVKELTETIDKQNSRIIKLEEKYENKEEK